MGLGPIAKWKEAKLPDLWQRLRWALAVSVVSAILVPLVAGKWTPMKSFGLLLAFWIVSSAVVAVLDRTRGVRSGVLAQLARQPRSFWGMILAHLGVAVFIVGVTLVKGYETERDVRMAVGDTVTVGAHTFRFDGVAERRGPNYRATRGTFTVTRDGAQVDVMHPEKRVYNAGGMPMTEAAIDSGPFGDRYVSLGDPVGDGSWSVRVYSKPFVTWIWGGCILMALGGFIALLDRRYRTVTRREAALPKGARAAGAD
jgi:cytochrome c-type biogenesis protein CcmF